MLAPELVVVDDTASDVCSLCGNHRSRGRISRDRLKSESHLSVTLLHSRRGVVLSPFVALSRIFITSTRSVQICRSQQSSQIHLSRVLL